MHVSRPLLLASLVLAASFAAHAQTSPTDAMQTCKNAASDKLPNVPRAYIGVQRGSNAGDGSYMINFRSQPPNGRPSSGFCIISQRGQLKNFQFDPPTGGGGNNSGGIGGNHGGRISANDAMQACKNSASNRLPNVPRAFIIVQRGTDPGDGGYMINFRSQPPNGRPSSGFCNVTWNGRVKNLQFDPPTPGYGGGNPTGPTQNFGGQTPLEAMKSCKATVSQRFPNVPLAYIQVDQPRVNGASLLANFRVQSPDGLRANGSCDVFKNGKVNLTVR